MFVSVNFSEKVHPNVSTSSNDNASQNMVGSGERSHVPLFAHDRSANHGKDQSMSARKRFVRSFIGALLVVLGLILIPTNPAGATDTTVEAETAGTNLVGWYTTGEFAGKAGLRYEGTGTATADIPITVPSGNTADVVLWCYLDSADRGIKAKVDGGSYTASAHTGTTGHQACVTLTGVSAGSHTIGLSYNSTSGSSAFVDKVVVSSTPVAPTTYPGQGTGVATSWPDPLGARARCNLAIHGNATMSPTAEIACQGPTVTTGYRLYQLNLVVRMARGDGVQDYAACSVIDSLLTESPTGQYRGTCQFPLTTTNPGPWSRVSSVAAWSDASGYSARPGFSGSFSGGAVILNETIGSAAPTMPIDYYTGGGLGFSSPPAPTCTLSRTLAQNNGSNVATFTGNTSPVSGAIDTYSLAWGDGATAGTSKNGQHIYSAVASMPSGGWTAILTVTRTGDGVTYSTSSPQTVTCSVRVDFLNPTQTTAGGSTFDQDDSDCPSGFGWLNPLAIVGVLKCLFIPSPASVSSLGGLWGTMTTKAPFSYAYEVVTLPANIVEVPRHYWGLQTSGGSDQCNHAGFALPYSPIFNLCDVVPDTGPMVWIFSAIRSGMFALFALGLGMATYRVVIWTIS